MFEHVSDEGDDMQTGKCFGISLIIFDEPSATCGPGEGSFDDPTARQQDKAAFCFGQLDHFELDAFCGSGLRSCFAGVALIDVSQLNAIACRLLYVGCTPGDSRAVADIGRWALLQTLPQSVGAGQRGAGGAGDVGLQGAAL